MNFTKSFEDYLTGEIPSLKHGLVIDLGKIPDVEDPKSITNPKTAVLLLVLPLVFHFSNNIQESEKGLIVFDEAWRLLKVNQAKTILELAFRTFRSRNIAIMFITQDFEDVYESEIGHVLLNNSDIHVVLKQRSEKSIEYVKKFYNLSDDKLIFIEPSVNVGTGILITRGMQIPIHLEPHGVEWKILPK